MHANFFHVAVLPCMLTKGRQTLFCGRLGWYAFSSHIFPPTLHYFSTPSHPISNTSFHVPHEHPSPPIDPSPRPHHQITSPFYLPPPIHPSTSIFSEIILPDALLENFLHYFFTTRIHLHLTLTVHCYRIASF